MNGLEEIYGDRIQFVHANVMNADSRPLMAQYGFNSAPEFYLVDPQGKIIGFWNDELAADELQRAFDAALAAPCPAR